MLAKSNKMLNLKILALLVSVHLTHSPTYCLSDEVKSNRFMPEQFHCSASLFQASKKPIVDPDFFKVDEYVDLPSNRSSISIYNRWTDHRVVYYNKVSPDEKYSNRKFLRYDPVKRTCEAERIGFWPLEPLRKVAILLYPEISELNKLDVDVAIGPSIILYAIDNNSDQFRFVSTQLSKGRLTNVDVYSRRLQVITVEEYDDVDVIVHVISRGRKNQKPGETLAASVDVHTHLNIASVVACKVRNKDGLNSDSDSDSDSDSTGAESKYKPGNTNEPAEYDSDYDDFNCKFDDIMFQIEYDTLTEISAFESGSSLIGGKLDDQENHYDFDRDPFLLPIGIGCREIIAANEWEPKFQPPTQQFSGQFVTNNGSKGVSYVAYDGLTNILRLDRNGRKNIYDLKSGKSYHIGEFSSAYDSEVLGGPQEEVFPVDRCIVLDSDADMHLDSTVDVWRIMGLYGQQRTHYMGSKVIDHIHYEVFEAYFFNLNKYGLTMPILMEAHGFWGPKQFKEGSYEYMLTFYVRVYSDMKWSTRFKDGMKDQNKPMMLPEFVEFWLWSKEDRQRRLLNRLTFTEFSWSLDVEPFNDPDSQKQASSSLFSIQQCYPDRGGQAELAFIVSRSPHQSSITEEKLVGLRSNSLYVNEYMAERLALSLGISRLNIAQLETKIRNDGSIVVRSRLSELIQGLVHEKQLGGLRFDGQSDLLVNNILRVYNNRHSMDECRLDSVALSEPNWFAYCPHLTICVMLAQNEELAFDVAEKGDDTANEKTNDDVIRNGEDLCEVRQFKWAARSDPTVQQVIRLVDENKYQIGGSKFEFNYKYTTTTATDGPQLMDGQYLGYGVAPHLQLLDSVGFRLAAGARSMSDSPLSGLRYSTMQEEPEAHNMNRRVALSANMDTFKHCQLACQMDDLCGSFSVCLRRRKDSSKRDECILSTVRLTGERLNRIARLSNGRKQSSDKFEVKLTSLSESQVFVMYHNDNDCSLHANDILADYTIKKTIMVVEPERTNSTVSDVSKTSDNKPPVEHQTHVSLEECAGQSYELNLFGDPVNSNFTYCPIDSTCLVGGETLKEVLSLEKHCFVYAKKFTRFYEMNRLTHLVVTLPNEEVEPKSAADETKPSDSTKVHRDLVRDMEKFELARSFWGLKEENCARDCNLHQSNCLAFDSCHGLDNPVTNRILCIMFTIRSPLSARGMNLPLLPREQQLEGSQKGKAELTSSLFCNHYRLKSGYFDVRLKQMLAEAGQTQENASGNSEGGGEWAPSERCDKMDAVEDKILDEDRRLSDHTKVEVEVIGDGDQATMDGERPRLHQPVVGVHWAALLAGLLMGSLGVLYGRQVVGAGLQFYYYHKSNGAPANDGLSQLVLNDSL